MNCDSEHKLYPEQRTPGDRTRVARPQACSTTSGADPTRSRSVVPSSASISPRTRASASDGHIRHDAHAAFAYDLHQLQRGEALRSERLHADLICLGLREAIRTNRHRRERSVAFGCNQSPEFNFRSSFLSVFPSMIAPPVCQPFISTDQYAMETSFGADIWPK